MEQIIYHYEHSKGNQIYSHNNGLVHNCVLQQ